jgi:hypothetical protein
MHEQAVPHATTQAYTKVWGVCVVVNGRAETTATWLVWRHAGKTATYQQHNHSYNAETARQSQLERQRQPQQSSNTITTLKEYTGSSTGVLSTLWRINAVYNRHHQVQDGVSVHLPRFVRSCWHIRALLSTIMSPPAVSVCVELAQVACSSMPY